MLNDYARMIADESRTGAYVAALESCVRPGQIVCDIGAGTGFLAIVACRLGARRVYAIETNEVVGIGPELAASNGCADRIVFLREDALKVELPERADVVVADLRGALPIALDALAILERARERFLGPGGTLIPAHDELFAAVVTGDVRAAALGPERAAGVDLRVMREHLVNTVYKDTKRSVGDNDLVTAPARWATLDYATARHEPVRGTAGWTMERAGVGHGLLIWFEATLTASARYSSAPGLRSVYSQVFLPWERSLDLEPGDRVEIDLRVQPEGHPWSWTTRVTQRAGSLHFRQSSFLGAPSRPERRER